jgi:glycosyltransferase involved in cell wall biosynthesis
MLTSDGTDILMITYNRPSYTRLALAELLARCDDSMRVWVWHNGPDAETLAVVKDFEGHPRFHRLHHSERNLGLTAPTNWLFENATGAYLSKVDDDCVVPLDWGAKLRAMHEDEPKLGVIGCWRFQEEDFVPELALPKIREVSGGHRLLVNLWVEGSGYLMKRACVDRFGPLGDGQSFTDYCIQIGRAGWINGWAYPFLYQEHMDDPRAEHSGLKSDADLERFLPLSAKRNGVTSIEEWLAQLRRSARRVQAAPVDPAYWSPTRRRMRQLAGRLRRLVTGSKQQW